MVSLFGDTDIKSCLDSMVGLLLMVLIGGHGPRGVYQLSYITSARDGVVIIVER
jgi:ABC-type tungstate transport system substrate-binding protein